MHILRHNNHCLTKDEKIILNNLFSHSPELARAYKLAIKLTQLLNTHMDREEALIKIHAWIKEVRQSKLTCFNKFIKTLLKYKQQVVNYFIDRNSSGFVEGLNNKVKVLKRRCYGIFTLKHFFQRLHLDISGYDILLGNSAC
jgi:transposase